MVNSSLEAIQIKINKLYSQLSAALDFALALQPILNLQQARTLETNLK